MLFTNCYQLGIFSCLHYAKEYFFFSSLLNFIMVNSFNPIKNQCLSMFRLRCLANLFTVLILFWLSRFFCVLLFLSIFMYRRKSMQLNFLTLVSILLGALFFFAACVLGRVELGKIHENSSDSFVFFFRCHGFLVYSIFLWLVKF